MKHSDSLPTDFRTTTPSARRRRSEVSPQHLSWTPSSAAASIQRRRSSLALDATATSSSIPTPSKRTLTKKKKKQHHQLMESFRDFLEELPDHHHHAYQGRHQQPEDKVGDFLTDILNTDPHFQYQTTTNDDHNLAKEYPMEFRPLISLRNWKRLQAVFACVYHILIHSNPVRDIPVLYKNLYRFLFWNAKDSIQNVLVSFGGLLLLFSVGTATTMVLLGIWIWKFLAVTTMLLCSFLFDWKEITNLTPGPFRSILASIIDVAQCIDRIVLFGKRYRGREWNKDEFELVHFANTAQSSQRGQYLWRMPPPTVRELGSEESTDPEKILKREWSQETVEHVAAIDFCYLVLREDFVQNQYRKLREAVFKKPAKNHVNVDGVTDSVSLRCETGKSARRSRCTTDDSFLPRIISRSFSSDSMCEKLDDDDRGGQRRPNAAVDTTLSLRLDDVLRTDGEDDETSEGDKDSTTGSNRTSVGNSSDPGVDMNWMDVGAEIGIKLLGSAAVQKAMTSHDTAEKINTLKDRVESSLAAVKDTDSKRSDRSINRSTPDEPERRNLKTLEQVTGSLAGCANPISVPVHTMWTSASAALASVGSIEIPDDKNQALGALRSDLRLTNGDSNSSLFHVRGMDSIEAELSVIPTYQARNSTQRRSSATKQSIEMICDGADSTQITIKPNTPKALVAKRPLLLPGTKIVVPIFPTLPTQSKRRKPLSSYQMGTVVASKRLCIFKKNHMPRSGARSTNCLAITVKLDRCFLRNGDFASLTLRVMDEWSHRYMPRHSKLPLGSCVSTTYGIGVLVGWRVEDDCHIVRCLWQRRGHGSACAYLRREAIHSTMEAAIGFEVHTSIGRGTVIAYTNGGIDFRCGRYFVSITDEGRHFQEVLELNRSDVLSCEGAQFTPVVEHIREAAQYQLQLDFYQELLCEGESSDHDDFDESKLLSKFSKHFVTIWQSFLRAIDEDDEFDEGMNAFIQSCVHFLNKLDGPERMESLRKLDANVLISTTETSSVTSSKTPLPQMESPSDTLPTSGLWWMDNMFGILRGGENHLHSSEDNSSEGIEVECAPKRNPGSDKTYKRAFAIIRTLMRTIAIAQAASVDEPDFKMGLSVCYECLLFVKTIVKVQRKNMNPESLLVWRRAWEEIVSVFGPVKDRLTKIGEGIAERMEKQGRRAKVRLLRFVDIIVQDDVLLQAVEQGDWGRCAEQVERTLVKAKIIDESSQEHYHKTGLFIYNHFASATSQSKGAAARNNEKVERFLMFVQMLVAPRKTILSLFLNDDFLDILERILVRVFSNETSASRMLTIHSSNFQSLRQLRMLKDFTIAGKFWIPMLDAADEELSWAVSHLPENAKEYFCPVSSLFSLCVAQFHKIYNGDLTKDWLDFLMEDEAVKIVHEIDMKLILALQSFSRDVKETMIVLPYYPSIDADILNLVDELNVDKFVKEASVALEDEDLLRQFIKEKATIAIERLLDYIPKLSIPVEKRDLPDGWTLTCRASDGGHLQLNDLVIKRENLICQVMGGDTIFFPMMEGEDIDEVGTFSATVPIAPVEPEEGLPTVEEASILDDIREIILNAQRYGCWHVGVGGVKNVPSDKRAAAALQGLPVSSVLNCAIDLWRNLEIDDDELLEIAIRDVSYQIQLQKQREEDGDDPTEKETKEDLSHSDNLKASMSFLDMHQDDIQDPTIRRFNPRSDPTVLYLEIKKLTFNLENFHFRIEKHESKRTIFDPTFEGTGSVLVKNVSVKLRVECLKEYVNKAGQEIGVPILQLSELDASIEKVQLRVQDTGADWLLNKLVDGFGDKLTEIMSANLCEQVRNQIDDALSNLNQYFATNPKVILGLLNISLDDLDERVVWV